MSQTIIYQDVCQEKPQNKDLDNPKGKDFVVPLMPSQLSIVKSLVWIFKILSGKLSNAEIGAETMLETNRNKTNLVTRRRESLNTPKGRIP